MVIYDSTIAAGKGEGVYIEAVATELKSPREIKFAHQLLQKRHKPASYWKLNQVHGNAPIRLYKAKPKRIWVNGEGAVDDTYIDTKTEVKPDLL